MRFAKERIDAGHSSDWLSSEEEAVLLAKVRAGRASKDEHWRLILNYREICDQMAVRLAPAGWDLHMALNLGSQILREVVEDPNCVRPLAELGRRMKNEFDRITMLRGIY